MIGDAPVEAVGAHVHQAAAAIGIGLQGIEHRFRIIFRVRPRHHAAIGPQAVNTLGREIVLGDDVIGNLILFQPVGEMRIGVELPQIGLWPHVENGPEM